MRVAFVGKGGAGKSSLAGTFARVLAGTGERVLRDSYRRFARDGHASGRAASLPGLPLWRHCRRRFRGVAQPQRSGNRTSADRKQTATVRDWARSNGYTVSDRGRIPTAVQDAFDSAH